MSDNKNIFQNKDQVASKNFIKIGERTFKLGDQNKFSDLSGDYNPIHIDIVEARKTQKGKCIVHGVNGLLWSLDCLSRICKKIPVKFEIKFQKSINIDSKVICLWNDLKRIVKIETEGNDTLFSLYYDKFIDEDENFLNIPTDLKDNLKNPIENDINKLVKETKYPMKYGGNPSLAEFLYPNLSCKIGSNTVYEISLLSNIVGMQLPGLHSLFLSVKVELIRHHNKVISPYFKLDHIDHRFGIINLDYFGNNIACKLKTLERPHYKIKKCSDIEGKIPESLSLNGKKILIIGGSRGIGATLAKVTAMIGAKITITYNTGIEDARKLRNDIESFTGQKTEVLRLDISDIIQIKTFKFDYDFLFFFASPKIIETKAEFDFNLFDNFYKIYCKSFYIIAMNFNKSGGRLIYWPSTIFLSQDIKNFKEYVLAKSIGEKICKSLKSETQMKVIFERLEKTETDQTLSLIKESMQDSVDVAINIMKLVCDKK